MNRWSKKRRGPIKQELYIIRHGETDYNRSQIIQGRGVNTSINEMGKWQARSFFEHYRSVAFDIIYTSKLVRTQETIQPFIEAGYAYNVYPELDEIDWGIHEGKTASLDMKSEYDFITRSWREGDLEKKIPGGENPMELQARQKQFIENVLADVEGKILICSHGRAMRSLLCTLLDKPLHMMDEFPHSNLSLYKLNKYDEGYSLELFNYLGHLNGNA